MAFLMPIDFFCNFTNDNLMFNHKDLNSLPMLNKLILGIFLLAPCSSMVAQNPKQGVIYHQSFDAPQSEAIRMAEIATRDSSSLFQVHTSSYSEGLKGKALDLTDEVAYRIPLSLTKKDCPSFDDGCSFSLQVWVKTKPNAPLGTPIMTNTTTHDPTGWCIGTQENGAWYLSLYDGKNSYTYQPTAQRQAINDGKWHQITVSIDKTQKEVWMYLDGRNVAIYHIEGLKSLESKFRTFIGGSDEYQDWGCHGEWTAFNGKIDEVRMWNRPVSSTEVRESYEQFFPLPPLYPSYKPDQLKVQVWNIWHGGHRFGKQVGVNRVIEVLKKENADVIGLIETYGSGAIIADSLGYYFYLISSNLSIMSRYPIDKTIRLFHPFNSGGALIRLSEKQRIAFYDIWLQCMPDVSEQNKGMAAVKKYEEEEAQTRVPEIKEILKQMSPYTAQSAETPVILVGDFNCDSHLDWNEQYLGSYAKSQVSPLVIGEGFTDSFRHLYPNVSLCPGATWSPTMNLGFRELRCPPQRIDFIYYKGDKLIPYRSETLSHHPVGWPSDHGSVVTSFYFK